MMAWSVTDQQSAQNTHCTLSMFVDNEDLTQRTAHEQPTN